MPRQVTLGADPELFILNPSGHTTLSGKSYVPVCGLMGGDKGKPVIVDQKAGGWLEDGVTLELNPNPSESALELADHVSTIRRIADEKLMREFKYRTQIGSSAKFKTYDLQKHPKAVEFGCSVDYSAYDRGAARVPPMTKAMAELGDGIRFAGGHVHLGVKDWPEELPKFIAIRLMDLLMGLPYERIYYGEGGLRRPYYGLPGLYRETSYGVEYRTLTNSWLNEVRGGTPYLLGRLKLIGLIIGDFENTKDDLIKLYNSVEWQQFYDEFKDLNFQDVLRAISPELLIANSRVKIGKWQIALLDHRDTRDERGLKIKDLFDPGSKVPPKNDRMMQLAVDWAQYDHIRVKLFRSNMPENVQDVSLPGNLVTDYLREFFDRDGRVVDVDTDDGIIWVEFPENSEHEWLPRRDARVNVQERRMVERNIIDRQIDMILDRDVAPVADAWEVRDNNG